MDDKKSIIELVGIIAVVASLIFVGMEVRQSATETRSSTVQQHRDSWMQLSLAMMGNQELFEALQKLDKEGRESDRMATFTVDAYLRALFHSYNSAYFHYKNGTLDESQWIPIARNVEDGARRKYVHGFWSRWRSLYDEDFAKFVDDVFSRAEPVMNSIDQDFRSEK
jgi:hypothetical protein